MFEVWTNHQGAHLVEEMEQSHIVNTLRLLKETAKDIGPNEYVRPRRVWIKVFEEELQRRKRMRAFKKGGEGV